MRINMQYIGKIPSYLGDTITEWLIVDMEGNELGTEIIMEVRDDIPNT